MIRRLILALGAVGAFVGFAAWWRQHPRFGASWVNRVVDPWLVRQGVVESSRGEIGLLEHVGRKTGAVRVCPVHPVRTADGFRIVVPLGDESQWARNVLAAGHCRLQLGEVVHELDEPRLVVPSAVEGLPKPATRVMDWLGFRYLMLRQFAERPGELETGETGPAEAAEVEVKPRANDETEVAPPEAVPTA